MPPSTRRGAEDITDLVRSRVALPQPPANIFATPDVVMRGAQETTYLGTFTEEEAREVVSKHFTTTRGNEMLLNLIAHDVRFGYEGSVAAIVRHAVELLLQYYLEHTDMLAEHNNWASETVRMQQESRLAQHRAKLRTSLKENIAAWDDDIHTAVQCGDMEYIAHQLQLYLDMLRACESVSQKQALWKTFSQSIETRSAASVFYDWTHNPDRAEVDTWDEGWPALAEEWQRFFEEATE